MKPYIIVRPPRRTVTLSTAAGIFAVGALLGAALFINDAERLEAHIVKQCSEKGNHVTMNQAIIKCTVH